MFERIALLISLTIFICLIYAESEKYLVRNKRIINGRNGRVKDFPYMVSIQGSERNKLESMFLGKVGKSYCGGSLISNEWVLTAAHCFDSSNKKKLNNPSKWHIRIADEKIRPGKTEKLKNYLNLFSNKLFGTQKEQSYYHASKIFIHPHYKQGVLENDIALLKLKEKLDFKVLGDAGAISLPPPNSANWPPVNQVCLVSGWGCGKAGGSVQYQVKEAQLPIVAGNECRSMYGKNANINLTDTKEFCAGYYNKGVSICPGDSGGPLACKIGDRTVLAGVVSAAHKKEPENYPGLFTRVSYYVNWIDAVVRAN